MAFPNEVYAPAGVYTKTNYENPVTGLLSGIRLPVFIGTGSESLSQSNLEMIRGSSASVDQYIVEEDETGRSVVSISTAGAVTLGAFDGVRTRIQTKKCPITTGKGTGTTATKTSAVSVTINGQPIVVTSMSAATGILSLAVAPALGDEVRVSYYFKRTDTQITDTVTSQVTADGATLYGAIGQSFSVATGENDTLILTVDDTTDVTITIPSSGSSTWTAAQIASFVVAGAGSTSLSATATTNNFGNTVVVLTADGNLTVGAGTANSTLGFTAGDATSRNKVFYTFQGPIVDGSNGGVTTTDPSDVTVLVDGVQVTPTSVDGASRAVTLPTAPVDGSVVTIQYYFNAWQDTFDYLMHTSVTEITQCGVTPTRSDYTDGVDFILKNDRIVWGTSVLVSSGEHTADTTYFGESQVSGVLVDTRGYLQPTTAVVNTAVSPPRESRTQFTLARVPTTGNGRNSPLGSSLFQTVSNDRIDLPTDRPDLVLAFWGFGVQDAIERGAVTVTAVDSSTSTITLKDPVPVGASVYATYYYNTLIDQAYSLTSVVSGASGVGTYTVSNEDGTVLLTPTYGTKSSGLATITLQFPSGSERKPDVRFETPTVTTDYTGSVVEDVTVTFKATDGTLAMYTTPGAGDYEIVLNASDRIRLTVDGSALAGGASGIDLGSVNGVANLGFVASMLGGEIAYTADSGYTSYDVDSTNDSVNLMVDGVLVSATAGSGLGVTLGDYVTAINAAALAAPPQFVAAGQFLSSVVITASEYDQVRFHYTGDVAGVSGNLICTLTPGTYASVSALAAQVQTQMMAAIAAYIVVPHAAFTGLAVAVTANSTGNLVFTLTKASGDAAGYLEFITNGTPGRDFAVLAGIDTAAATAGAQTKVLSGPIARRFSIVGDNTSGLLHDRLVLRSRIVPGFGTVYPFTTLAYTGIEVQGSSGATATGLTVQASTSAGWSATVHGATLLGNVGFAGGQVASGTYADVRDGQPLVTFYAAGGTTDQNNVFKFTMDGVPVTVLFTDATGTAIASGASAEVPLGPASSANTVLGQIRAAITAAGIASASARCVQEGAAIRLYSALSSSASSIVVGNGNANTLLGFNEGDVTERTLVAPSVLASGLMAHSGASVAAVLTAWDAPSATYFAAEALAGVETDSAGAEYLYLQSQGNVALGTSSSIAFATASSASILLPTTGLGVVTGDGATGEIGISGYYVTSSDPVNGSGTVNTSLLQGSGLGQDGIVGQTYTDLVTGLTFTVLAREGGADYPAAEYFTFKVRTAATTDSNLPVNTIPGLELLVTNTLGVGVGDTAIVETFERGGLEPATGDTYYVSYNYTKQDYNTEVYTRFATVESVYGTLSPDNPVSLAAYLAMLNGAVIVGIKQVQKDTDDNGDGIYDSASVTAYRDAVDQLNGLVKGTIPNILVPLLGSSTPFFQYITQQADIQSDIRHQSERTVIAGVSSGTTPRTVGTIAQAVQRDRFRLVYPDILIVPIPQAGGQDEEVLVDGTYLAAMLAGAVVSQNVDVATPWTHRRLQGATQLARTLDAVEQNQVAVKGVTVIEDRSPVLRVRQGYTTDMVGASTDGNAQLSQLPTIKQIVDEVQQQTRKTLDRFIGTKFLPGVLSQIEGQLSNTLKLLVQAQILTAFTGVKANIAADNPTVAEVEAFIRPVFPLLYILVNFNLRSTGR